MSNNKRSGLTEVGHHLTNYTSRELDVVTELAGAFEESGLSLAHRLQAFPRHVRRQDIARFLVKYEIFKLSLPANGVIVECGVFSGTGLISWLHFSSIFEPYNHSRRIIGFDTFSGFPEIDEKDISPYSSEHLRVGFFETNKNILEEIQQLVALHDQNRPLGHIPKVELAVGEATKTIPQYIETHPHLLISLLYLDFDIYEPTKVALEHLYPRVVPGGIVAFDELNCPEFPGETVALLETLGLGRAHLCRFPTDPYISYFIKE